MNQLTCRHSLAPFDGHCLGHGATLVQAVAGDTSFQVACAFSGQRHRHECPITLPRSKVCLL